MIVLPKLPEKTSTPSLKTNAIMLTPTLGGPSRRVTRMGDRWSLTVDTYTIGYNDAMPIIAALNYGLTQMVAYPISQGRFATTGAGTPSFSNGSGQAATIHSMTPGYKIKSGQFFNIVNTEGSETMTYLHMATADATVAANGNVNVSFIPGLRTEINSASPCEFETPYITGFISGDSFSFGVNRNAVTSFNFTITESE